MMTIQNQTARFLRVPLSRGKVLRLGPRKEGQISTQDAERESVKALVDDGTLKVMGVGPQAGSASPAQPASRATGHGPLPSVAGRRGDR